MDRYTHAFNIRDYIVLWRGLDNLIFDLVDRPEFIHKMMERLTAISLDILEQLEEKGLLGQLQSTIHCFGAWTDELPQDSYNPHPKANDLWTYGMAQIFSNVSPQMHNEFEIEYAHEMVWKLWLGLLWLLRTFGYKNGYRLQVAKYPEGFNEPVDQYGPGCGSHWERLCVFRKAYACVF